MKMYFFSFKVAFLELSNIRFREPKEPPQPVGVDTYSFGKNRSPASNTGMMDCHGPLSIAMATFGSEGRRPQTMGWKEKQSAFPLKDASIILSLTRIHGI